ncbi:PIG-L family deacetylase [Mucilaginibacter rubeus]|uniref:PIG-L family deacetylase n=1 Tax=Mucilaginibacter rubeus TaxID=2027860 RepID=A0AAE6JIH1_9SPHI|nr:MULTISPECIES: PIG-L family deacetylase [Mucilaginibacter]QEM06266.1 PIG-L family deacetylase [Mucilaginibacter rubeus]QEM18849.1 PIG-L family deacetylase [Mucilaginibacter gossypii]QTE44609.1 PIG-L family deacetylase [Mucilaginibacter rubeus]QTE51207.1 PIG-L family deacetylase [Mucilaginibacter rubeus]QTE56294.1 PIG-L family deacetylase [Mucilaginibacter rubeus]
MKRIHLIAIFLFATVFSKAQTNPPTDLGTIQQNLKKLDVLGSVLYVAAHPDDENTRLLAYLAQEKHYRTGYLSLTRGDGGQNLIGNEQSELLGLIRTQELLAARRIDGAEQFFTRANDFGFSKGPEETLKIWDKDKVLGDIVWVIRKFRPDVIICRFPTTGEGGHGHHTSSAILAQEAFTAAADPNRYPEQLKYVKPWQAKRLMWNTFSFGSVNTTAADQFKINVGVYNTILGKGYGEIAAESRSNHKTQGFGSAKQRGESYEFFKTILGDAPQNDLMDGVNTTWKRVKDGDAIAAMISVISRNFISEAPEKSLPALVQLLMKVEKVPDTYWREQKTKELNNLIAACAGLWFEAYATESTYPLGDKIGVRAQVINRFNYRVKINSIDANDSSLALQGKEIPFNQLQTFETTAAASMLTQPYWLASSHPIGVYTLQDNTLAGNPENPDLPKVTFQFIIEGKPINIDRRIVYKYVDPVRGEVYQPIEITPPVTANIEDKDYIFSAQQAQTVLVKLKSFTKASGTISLKPAAGWKISPEKIDFTDKDKNEEWSVAFTVTPTDTKTKTTDLEAVVNANGQPFSLSLRRIRYDHVPAITLFPPAQTKLVYLDLKHNGRKIGYIVGAGDQMPEALRQVGYDVHLLSENEVTNGDLSGYDAIVTGVRAYNVNERLAYQQSKLMAYVKNGGNLVVQYNNNNGIVVKQIGPYPFTVVNRRVTDENAEVTILDPQNPVLNYPNKITNDDFNGWIQERGLYFVSNIDPQYKPLLQMHDKGEEPLNGSLIVGDYGKGRFIYTSLAFFRELPAGVPGAYRLFINLLSKPK